MTAPIGGDVAPSVDAVQSVLEQAQRLGLIWRLVPGTVVGTTGNVNNIAVTVDGDFTKQTRAQSLIGELLDATRVIVLIVPPANAYVIGFYGSYPLPDGLRDRIDSTSNSSPITAEAIVLTGHQMTFHNGRAYRIKWSQRLDHSAAQIVSIRVRQTNLIGTQLLFWQEQVLGTQGNNYYSEATLKRIAGSDLTDNIVLTLAASAGNVTARGAADTVRFLEVWDCGPAGDFPNANSI